jgi:hypothetical protein
MKPEGKDGESHGQGSETLDDVGDGLDGERVSSEDEGGCGGDEVPGEAVDFASIEEGAEEGGEEGEDEKGVKGVNGDVNDAIPAGVEAIKRVIQMEGGVSEGAEDVVGSEVRIDADLERAVGELGELGEESVAGGLAEDGIVEEVAVVIEDPGEVDGRGVKADGEDD